MKSLKLFGLVAVLAATPAAFAGFYVKGSGLYNSSSDIKLNNATAFKASLSSNVGYAGSLGFKFSAVRVEAEVQNFKSNVSDGTTGAGVVPATGSLKELNGYANVYLDIPAVLGVTPFVGAGLGYANLDFSNFSATQGATQVVKFFGKETVFGYQAIAGLQVHLFGAATLHAAYRIVKREDVAVREVVSNAQQSINLGTRHLFELGVAIGF